MATGFKKTRRGAPRVGLAIRIRPMDQFDVQDAARTIARAEEHKRDPELMAKVRDHIQSLSKAVGRAPREPSGPASLGQKKMAGPLKPVKKKI